LIAGALVSTGVAPSLASAQADPQYVTSKRIQLSEPCSLVAKWLSQALLAGPHWQLLGYEPDLGLLTFRVVASGNLSKADIRQYLRDDSKKARKIRTEQLVF
jgi:hypothetical protein